jgi:hypothetical protein
VRVVDGELLNAYRQRFLARSPAAAAALPVDGAAVLTTLRPRAGPPVESVAQPSPSETGGQRGGGRKRPSSGERGRGERKRSRRKPAASGDVASDDDDDDGGGGGDVIDVGGPGSRQASPPSSAAAGGDSPAATKAGKRAPASRTPTPKKKDGKAAPAAVPASNGGVGPNHQDSFISVQVDPAFGCTTELCLSCGSFVEDTASAVFCSQCGECYHGHCIYAGFRLGVVCARVCCAAHPPPRGAGGNPGGRAR